MTNITALRNHLSNVIYIENNFGLDLFKSKVEVERGGLENFEDAIDMRQPPSAVASQASVDETSVDNKSGSLSDFFGMAQRKAADINILPYYYDASAFWNQTDSLKKKLSHFPLIIIDWQLEEKDVKRTGIDVLETIIQNNEILHYYVIYSNEISSAMTSFSQKFNDVKIGEIKENGVIALDNAIVMFANKRTRNLNEIIEALENFTIDNYGYLPQLFLSVKQQIENKTAALYNEFMGLDTMMLPQLITDEAYSYNGLEDELLKTFIMNKLRDDLKITDNSSESYIKNSIRRLLSKQVSQTAFEKALSICNINREVPIVLTYAEYQERCSQVLTLNYMDLELLPALKLSAHLFVKGSVCTAKPEEITVLSNYDREKVYIFVLILSISNDENFLFNYVKLYKLIKLSEYKDDKKFSIKECFDASRCNTLCQGDVFIDDENNYLICVSPSCQLMRPKKINHCYMFLKGTIDSSANENQKQYYEISLLNKEMNKVVPVKISFFDPVVIDMSDGTHADKYQKYVRLFSLHIEYIHKVVELFSEYIKQIGVEELFGKTSALKDTFINIGDTQNDSN
ncbi:MAG: hypothetical protein IJX92_03665 [Clostridia bacterium]|nr:hypothetical protein [Clostridia bacterium]